MGNYPTGNETAAARGGEGLRRRAELRRERRDLGAKNRASTESTIMDGWYQNEPYMQTFSVKISRFFTNDIVHKFPQIAEDFDAF